MRLYINTWKSFVFIGSVLIVFGACSKKDDDDDDAAIVVTDADDPESSNALAAAFPDSLALTVFPTTADASLALAGIEDPNLGKTNAEMIEQNKDVLTGDADECLNPKLFKTFKDTPVTCYEFDSDMNPSEFADQAGKSWGTTDGTDGDGEACMVAFTRAEAADSIALVQKALAIVRGMICQAKKNADDNEVIAMPEAGKELNLKKAMEDAAGDDMPVTEAKIEAVADTALAEDETDVIYHSSVIIKDPSGNKMEVYLTNQKTTTGEKGKLSFKRPAIAGFQNLQNDPNNTANKYELLSIAYNFSEKDDVKSAKIDLRRAAILKSIESFNEDGLVNLEGIPENAGNSTAHMINYVSFDIDPDTSEGKFAYWMNPGGSYNESARGFVYNVDYKDEKLSGCGISGSANNVSIRKSFVDDDADLEPTGWWHPRFDQNISADKDPRFTASTGSKVTKQCFGQNAKKVYKVTTDHDRGYVLVDPAKSGITAPKPPGSNLPPPPKDVIN